MLATWIVDRGSHTAPQVSVPGAQRPAPHPQSSSALCRDLARPYDRFVQSVLVSVESVFPFVRGASRAALLVASGAYAPGRLGTQWIAMPRTTANSHSALR